MFFVVGHHPLYLCGSDGSGRSRGILRSCWHLQRGARTAVSKWGCVDMCGVVYVWYFWAWWVCIITEVIWYLDCQVWFKYWEYPRARVSRSQSGSEYRLVAQYIRNYERHVIKSKGSWCDNGSRERVQITVSYNTYTEQLSLRILPNRWTTNCSILQTVPEHSGNCTHGTFT